MMKISSLLTISNLLRAHRDILTVDGKRDNNYSLFPSSISFDKSLTRSSSALSFTSNLDGLCRQKQCIDLYSAASIRREKEEEEECYYLRSIFERHFFRFDFFYLRRKIRMTSNSTQMNYSSKVGAGSMPSTSNPIKDVFVDAMVSNKSIRFQCDFSKRYHLGCIENHQTCA